VYHYYFIIAVRQDLSLTLFHIININLLLP
jgi:hypothetical protein